MGRLPPEKGLSFPRGLLFYAFSIMMMHMDRKSGTAWMRITRPM